MRVKEMFILNFEPTTEHGRFTVVVVNDGTASFSDQSKESSEELEAWISGELGKGEHSGWTPYNNFESSVAWYTVNQLVSDFLGSTRWQKGSKIFVNKGSMDNYATKHPKDASNERKKFFNLTDWNDFMGVYSDVREFINQNEGTFLDDENASYYEEFMNVPSLEEDMEEAMGRVDLIRCIEILGRMVYHLDRAIEAYHRHCVLQKGLENVGIIDGIGNCWR